MSLALPPGTWTLYAVAVNSFACIGTLLDMTWLLPLMKPILIPYKRNVASLSPRSLCVPSPKIVVRAHHTMLEQMTLCDHEVHALDAPAHVQSRCGGPWHSTEVRLRNTEHQRSRACSLFCPAYRSVNRGSPSRVFAFTTRDVRTCSSSIEPLLHQTPCR